MTTPLIRADTTINTNVKGSKVFALAFVKVAGVTDVFTEADIRGFVLPKLGDSSLLGSAIVQLDSVSSGKDFHSGRGDEAFTGLLTKVFNNGVVSGTTTENPSDLGDGINVYFMTMDGLNETAVRGVLSSSPEEVIREVIGSNLNVMFVASAVDTTFTTKSYDGTITSHSGTFTKTTDSRGLMSVLPSSIIGYDQGAATETMLLSTAGSYTVAMVLNLNNQTNTSILRNASDSFSFNLNAGSGGVKVFPPAGGTPPFTNMNAGDHTYDYDEMKQAEYVIIIASVDNHNQHVDGGTLSANALVRYKASDGTIKRVAHVSGTHTRTEKPRSPLPIYISIGEGGFISGADNTLNSLDYSIYEMMLVDEYMALDDAKYQELENYFLNKYLNS